MVIGKDLKRISALVLVMVLLMAAVPAFAVQGSAAGEHKTVRMGYFEFGGMFEGAADGLKKSGYCYEYMMNIAVFTGWNYEFVYGSYSELYDMLKDGEIDILPYTNYNEQRGNEVLFSDKDLAEEEYYIAVRNDNSDFWGKGIDALNGKTITTLKGADYNSLLLEYIESNNLDVDVTYYRSLEDTWKLVENGGADATVFTSNAYNNDGWNCICSFGKKPTYIALAQDRTDLLEQLNDAMALLEREDPALLGKLYAKYFTDNPMLQSLTPEEQQWLEAHPVIRVGGFTNDDPDLHFVEGDPSKAEGLTVDVINGIIERLNLGITAEFTAFDTIEEMKVAMDAGEIDVFYPFYPNFYIAQQQDLEISQNIRTASMELVYRIGTSYEEALSRIATPSTRLGIYYVQEYYPDSEIIGAFSVPDAVDKVRKGAALGAIAYNEAIHPEQEKYSNLNYVMLLDGCGTCFAARPEDHAAIMLIDRGMNYFDNAEITALTSKYSGNAAISTRAYLATHKEVIFLIALVALAMIGLALAFAQMSRLKQKADAASQSKSTFLFNMSHDIRTPMNAITGFTERAIRHKDDPKVLEESLDKVKTSSEYLLKIINDILDMAKIESGKLEIQEQLNYVDDGNRTILEMFGSEAARKGIELHHSFSITDKYLWFDGDRTLQIVANLLSNAIKYTHAGGEIWYSIDQIPSDKDGYAAFVLKVRDTGIGMSPEFLSRVFDSFEREQSATKSGAQGTGLGMSIVKKLCDAMGIRIDIKSTQGVGTSVTLVMEDRIATPEEIEKFKADLAGKTMEERKISFEGKRILVVEDNELNREIIVDLLEEQGLNVDTTIDGVYAVDIIKDIVDRKAFGYYAAVLMDIQMPTMNGYEATKAIRAIPVPEGEHLPIIAMTANAFEEDKQAARDAGMDDHVAKPINVEELFTALARFM